MTANHHQPEFIRRKFTLPPDTDNLLVSLAERHYQGNVSLYLRAAIEDHRNTLENADSTERSLHTLLKRMGEIDSTQADIREILTAIEKLLREQHTLKENGSYDIAPSLQFIEQQILTSCVKESNGLRLEDIREDTNLPVKEIQSALHSLLDTGYITQRSDGRFIPTGTQSVRDSDRL